jgi:hypothetical protein
MLCPALLGIFSMTNNYPYLTLPNPNPNLTLILVFWQLCNPALIWQRLNYFFKLIAVAVAAAAANVLSCWILPFIILDILNFIILGSSLILSLETCPSPRSR